jgi:hypothetical protein
MPARPDTLSAFGAPARRGVWGCVALVAAAAVFGLLHLWFTLGPGILSPSDPFWTLPLNDTSVAMLGAEAFARDPAWHFPLASTSRLLSGGQAISIVYTDSAPWIVVLLKALGLGVEDVSGIGMVAALAVVLQPVAFALLLMALGVRRVESVLIGAFLGSMLPAWYLRGVWHVALWSHWVVVLALAVAAWAVRKGVSNWVIAGLAGLGALSIGIHAYLFVMVAAIAAGALLADVARLGLKAVPRAAAGLAIFLAASGLAAWVLGYASGGGVDGFGLFSMNLLSPLVPQRSGIAQTLLGDARPFLDATGRQYEGFNYLGGGILRCLGLAAWLFVRRRGPGADWRAAAPLIAALLALTALALSNKVYAGHRLLLDVPVPAPLMALFNEVRSSGRLFWPVAYALLAVSILALDRAPKRMLVGLGLAVALGLQFADTRILRWSLGESYKPSGQPALFDAGPWKRGPFSGHNLRVLPSYLCTAAGVDHETVRQAALAAERGGGVVHGGPVARFDTDRCAAETAQHVIPAETDIWIDLLMTQSLPASMSAEAARSEQCMAIPRGFLCGQAVAETKAARVQ